MKITNLQLINFRNYDSVNIDFGSNINIIYGNNGEGKTNLVEAIYLLALTKSFRVNSDKYLLKKGELSTKISGVIKKNNIEENYQVIINDKGKQVIIDNNKADKISDYIANIRIILFYPRDTEIITSMPSERRKLLNIEISQIYKEYLIVLANYNKVIKQRNAYLKELLINGNASREYLDILTKKVVEFGKIIWKYRDDYINEINKYISDVYKNIFTFGDLKVRYVSDFKKSEAKILDQYRRNYSKEMSIGKTLFGIHHDDIEFLLDGNRLKEWGSQGQIKNAILSFKLSEIMLIKEIKGDFPILILDDLFSELDNEKINNILNMLNDNVQTFITTTNIEVIQNDIKNKSSIYKIENGLIKEVTDETRTTL